MNRETEPKGQGIYTRKARLAGEELPLFFAAIAREVSADHLTLVCIGTDRSTGDALGPLTGSRLAAHGFPHVIGTLPDPCDAQSIEEKLGSIPEHHTIVAIDACLGQRASVGSFLAGQGPLSPAESVGLSLPRVGHYSIAAVVNEKGPKPYWTLQSTSLHRVMDMASRIADAAASAFRLIP
ncbi:sporulation protein YyaC [Paenibacillus algicola]|uniref:Sporulation protein YyaC n=1 Tax=Paenibacillus algicola TaxID=2565926 RepID=A0A4P8XP36_9BACL|nr:spore protease YyaC [Paenibacillus algicola]QCT04243.1 sporulation protein YyaC [Paenibacillus algicola]